MIKLQIIFFETNDKIEKEIEDETWKKGKKRQYLISN